MLAKKCDRCGKLYEHYDKAGDERQNGVSIIYVNKFGSRERIIVDKDLCGDCMQSLINWLNKNGSDENIIDEETTYTEIEAARCSRLKNWETINNMRGYYRYVIATEVAYEIFITEQRTGQVDSKAIANAYIAGPGRDADGNIVFNRALILKNAPVYKCIEAVVRDYKENIAND